MFFQGACYTDQGGVRESNQDACTVKVARTSRGQVALAVVCDGMGGLVQGELASAEMLREFDSWFWHYLPDLLQQGLTPQALSAQWNGLVQGTNRRLREYGQAQGITLGTTVTALLAAEGRYYLLHVGDCRAYLLQGGGVLQLTEDQTLAARELQAGRLRPEDFPADPRQHVLLQCVGIAEVLPSFFVGDCPEEGMFLLCSDGFYHTLSAGELAGLERESAAAMPIALENLGRLCRQRGETDNLTAAVLLCRGEGCPPTASMEGESREEDFRVVLDLRQIHTDRVI